MDKAFQVGFHKVASIKTILKKVLPDVTGRGELAKQVHKTRRLRDQYSKSSAEVDQLYDKVKAEYPQSNALDKMREAKKTYEAKKNEMKEKAKDLLKSANFSFAKMLRVGSTVGASGKATKTLNMSVPKGPSVKIIKPGVQGPNRT